MKRGAAEDVGHEQDIEGLVRRAKHASGSRLATLIRSMGARELHLHPIWAYLGERKGGVSIGGTGSRFGEPRSGSARGAKAGCRAELSGELGQLGGDAAQKEGLHVAGQVNSPIQRLCYHWTIKLPICNRQWTSSLPRMPIVMVMLRAWLLDDAAAEHSSDR